MNLRTSNTNDHEQTLEYIRKASPKESKQQYGKKAKRKSNKKSNNDGSNEKESNVIGNHEIGNTGKRRVDVLILGDSQPREMGAKRMSNDPHSIEKRFKPGMKIKETIQPTVKQTMM